MSDTAPGSRSGSLVGRYHLKRLLGRGDTGEVYEAVDTEKERAAAVKLLLPALDHDPAFREWLQREAVSVGRIEEPHVVPIRDYGEADGELFVDMPLVPGADLSALLKRTGVLSPPRAVNIVWQAALALDAAHAVGVIHRGVKPRNILVTDDDFVCLVDFGIAAAAGGPDSAETDNAGGRWKYSAPELFTGAQVGPGIDVYALACVFYQCLTGAPPYRTDSVKMLANAHATKPIPRPSQVGAEIPAALDEVIAKGMAKDAHERYSSAGELAKAAYQALSAQDQNRAVQFFEASQQAAPSQGPATSPPANDNAANDDAANDDAAHDDRLSHPPALPVRQDPRKRKQLLSFGVAALVVVAGLFGWLTHRSDPSRTAADTVAPGSATASGPPAATLSAAQARAQLLKLLPAGYPSEACTPTAPLAGALAAVNCGKNTDPGGPPSATYTLFSDVGALRLSFDSTVQTTNVVNCPGRIQSPGAWHRVATPEKPGGMLLCGLRQTYPTVVWTNDADLLVGALHADRNGSTLEQFYTWWSSHS